MMLMTKEVRLSDQQFQVVQAVTRRGEASVKDVQNELDHLKLAHTTVATVMSRLEKKGVLVSTIEGRERMYRCLVDEQLIRQSMVNSMISTLFKGDSKALMAHLIHEGEIDSNELDELKAMIQQGENYD
jgi:BlaI family penicillinase repressor